MNEALILKMAMPYVKNGVITYSNFDHLFDMLSLREQYQVVEILIKNDIQLADTEGDDSDEEIPDLLAFTPDDETLESQWENKNDFRVLYDESIFKDTATSDGGNEVFLFDKIEQSNAILCHLIQQGSAQARQDLCMKNERLVMKYAQAYNHYYGNDLDFDDLKQAGYIGLMRAAESFDNSMGNAFSTYATFWIKQSISRELMDHGFSIRIPVHMMEKIIKVTSLDNKYGAQGVDYQQRLSMISEDLGCRVDEVRNCIALRFQFLDSVSLNTPVGEEEDTELQDFIEDKDSQQTEETVMRSILHNQLETVVDTLTPRESDIIRLRFGLEDGVSCTLEEIGEKYRVTRERIRQIEAKALRKLRHPSRSKHIKDFL